MHQSFAPYYVKLSRENIQHNARVLLWLFQQHPQVSIFSGQYVVFDYNKTQPILVLIEGTILKTSKANPKNPKHLGRVTVRFVNNSEYKGGGSYGKVFATSIEKYRLMNNSLNSQEGKCRKLVKIKEVTPDQEPEYLANYRNEIEVNKALYGHTSELLESGNQIAFLRPELRGVPLLNLIWREKSKLTFRKGVEIALECARNIKVIHDEELLHGDVKPENFIVDISPANSVGKYPVVSIMDFGTVTYCPRVGFINDTVLTTDVYAAPENYDASQLRYTNPRINWSIDIYALGLIMIELLARMSYLEYLDTVLSTQDKHKSRSNYDDIYGRYLAPFIGCMHAQIQSRFADAFQALIMAMTNRNPAARPDIDGVIKDLECNLQTIYSCGAT